MTNYRASLGVLIAALAFSGCQERPSPFATDPGDEAVSFDGIPSAVLGVPGVEGNLAAGPPVGGSRIVAGGAGLGGLGAGTIEVEVPAGATIQSVLLYWGARGDAVDPTVMNVTAGGMTADVNGAYIGRDADAAPDSHSLRSDLLAEGFTFSAGATNTVDLLFADDQGVEGASVVITYDDGTAGTVQLLDGNDFAYLLQGLTVNPQTFNFPMAPDDRQATLLLVVGDVAGARPTRIEITSGGAGDLTLDNALGEGGDGRNGDEWDTFPIEVTVPAGSTQLTADLLSGPDNGGLQPASLFWVVGALELPDPPPPGGGEGCTPGYWKQRQHYDSWAAPYTPDTPFSDVFENAFPDMSLRDVLAQGGGGLKALGRHTVAALLNTASAGVSYDLTTGQVIAQFNDVFPSSKSEYNGLKNTFEGFNEQGCPLN